MHIENGSGVFYTCYDKYFRRNCSEFVFDDFEDLRNFILDITDGQIVFNDPELNQDSNEFKRKEHSNVVLPSFNLFSRYNDRRTFDICNTECKTWFDFVRITIIVGICDCYTIKIYNLSEDLGGGYLDKTDISIDDLKSSLYGSCLSKVFIYGRRDMYYDEYNPLEAIEEMMSCIEEQLDKEYILEFKDIDHVNKWLSEFTNCVSIVVPNYSKCPDTFNIKLNKKHMNLVDSIPIPEEEDQFSLLVTDEHTIGVRVKVTNQSDLNHPKIKNLFYHALLHGAKLI